MDRPGLMGVLPFRLTSKTNLSSKSDSILQSKLRPRLTTQAGWIGIQDLIAINMHAQQARMQIEIGGGSSMPDAQATVGARCSPSGG